VFVAVLLLCITVIQKSDIGVTYNPPDMNLINGENYQDEVPHRGWGEMVQRNREIESTVFTSHVTKTVHILPNDHDIDCN